jgi:endonuclease/exonuclease/phosphatase family metal-dependent hydrolase
MSRATLISFYLFSLLSSLNVMVVTQNQAGIVNLRLKDMNKNNQFNDYLTKIKAIFEENEIDLLIYNIQELIELKSGTLIKFKKLHNVFGLSNAEFDTSQQAIDIQALLQDKLGENFNYILMPNISMATIFIFKKNQDRIFKILGYDIQNANGRWVTANFNGGYWGQKGGIVTTFQFDDLLITNANVHLSSRDRNLRKNQLKGLLDKAEQMQLPYDNKNIKKFMFFTGDFNSRLSEEEKKEIEKLKDLNFQVRHYSRFHEKEEWSLEMKNENGILKEFQEGPTNFPPTYRLNQETNENCYETNNYQNCYKKSTFVYTDRIFFKGSQQNILKKYTIIKSQNFSDHLGVYAIFTIDSDPNNKILLNNDYYIEIAPKIINTLNHQIESELDSTEIMIDTSSKTNSIYQNQNSSKRSFNILGSLVFDDYFKKNEVENNTVDDYTLNKDGQLTIEDIKNNHFDTEFPEDNLIKNENQQLII